jgi:hypothetical protein
MDQTNFDPFADLASSAAASPCGCGGKRREEPEELSRERLDALLAAATAPGLAVGRDVPDLGALDAALRAFEASDLEAETSASPDELIRLARRYPGLKVTLSF